VDEPRWPPATYWMRVTAAVLLVVALARILLAIGDVLVLVLVSIILAFGFQPAVGWLTRRGLSRAGGRSPWACSSAAWSWGRSWRWSSPT
jgi:predicted PurR-regulated permease PerM